MSQQVRREPLQHHQDPPVLHALRDVLRRPDAFFAGLSRQGGLGRPAVFALACITVSTVLAWPVGGSGDGPTQGLLVPFLFDLVFFTAYVALTHAFVLLVLRRGSAGVAATFRIAAYGQVSQLVNWLPTVGLALGLLYGSVLAVIGVRRMHGATLRAAVAVVLLPLVVAAVLGGAYLLLR